MAAHLIDLAMRAIAGPATAAGLMLALLELLAGAGLLIGFVTPLASALAAVIFLLLAGSGLLHLNFGAGPSASLALDSSVIAIAIAFLGPGAFSLDARLFGRREIIIPPSSRPPQV